VVLATPELQLVETLPPPEEVAMVISREAEVSVKLPSVELERVATTLVACITKTSATDPEATVKLIAGEEREKTVLLVNVSGAALATNGMIITIPTRKTI